MYIPFKVVSHTVDILSTIVLFASDLQIAANYFQSVKKKLNGILWKQCSLSHNQKALCEKRVANVHSMHRSHYLIFYF